MEKTNFYMMMLNYHYVQSKNPTQEYVFSVNSEKHDIHYTMEPLDMIFMKIGEHLLQNEITDVLQSGQWEYIADTVTINRSAYEQLVNDSTRLAEIESQKEEL